MDNTFNNIENTTDAEELEQALELFNKSIDIITERFDASYAQDKIDLIELLIKRVTVYKIQERNHESLPDINKIITFANELKKDEPIKSDIYLARGYLLKGQYFVNSDKFWDATKEFTKAIDIFEKIKKIAPEFDINFLATAYMDRGSAYSTLDKFDRAIENLNKALEIYRTLQLENKVYKKDDFAFTLTSRGVNYARKKMLEDSLADLTEAINFQEHLFKLGELEDYVNLYLSYKTRSFIYESQGKVVEQQNDSDKCDDLLPLLNRD